MPEHSPTRYVEIGCRIPKEYFWVIGWGESDVGIETGSYDVALHMAGIENYNVMLYTSVLPPETAELPHLPDIHHGSVLEESSLFSIPISREHGSRLVCFWPRSIAIQTALTWADLHASMPATDRSKKRKPIYRKRCSSFFARRYKTRFYKLEFRKSVVRTYTPEKSFGTILVGIGFASYLVPVLKPEVAVTPSHKDKPHVKYTTT